VKEKESRNKAINYSNSFVVVKCCKKTSENLWRNLSLLWENCNRNLLIFSLVMIMSSIKKYRSFIRVRKIETIDNRLSNPLNKTKRLQKKCD
jgi:hypothetical protein